MHAGIRTVEKKPAAPRNKRRHFNSDNDLDDCVILPTAPIIKRTTSGVTSTSGGNVAPPPLVVTTLETTRRNATLIRGSRRASLKAPPSVKSLTGLLQTLYVSRLHTG